ncbi:MarR family winged helix-turn-helix transcriptional regulator [Kribbella sp. CA-293567]|uniref:MarR family winged helix-turn-helix transcriptional regulator n=1 Tax=Kribbella sp. CA-293567 TaxID=3002436 RepID=UPI0022DDB2F0|nr:MarR family transcriptional regulator [Kribbella sp. CA-293567]WBQ03528.1 MarR family transcriptional regulator [Kribbella sp. CA-293567]
MQREDLGSLFGRIARRLMLAEEPLLRRYGLSMWGYGVLAHLAKQPAANQLALATAIGYDKSRLITLLDELARDGLVIREQDPADRRNRQVRLTPAGESRLAEVRAAVHAMEDELLAELSPADRRSLIRMLTDLADG